MAVALMVALAVSAGAAVWVFRALYADGAFYTLTILNTADFFHVSQTRVSATLLTQSPLVAALRFGATDIRLLVRLYTATLFAVPTLAYAATAWAARKDTPLLVTTMAFVGAVFYPTSFDIIGEFHVLYSLYWLAFVLLLTGRGTWALPLIGLTLTRSYEISVVLCPILVLACLWRWRTARGTAAQGALLVSAALFAVGAWFGLMGGLFPRDPANAQNFAAGLRGLAGNSMPIEIAALFALAVAAGLVTRRWRAPAGGGVLLTSLGFAWRHLYAGATLGLGPAYAQRAVVVPIILALTLLAVLARRWPHPAGWPAHLVLLALLPAAAVFAIDLGDTLGWRTYMGGFCRALSTAPATPDGSFARDPSALKYGWTWTYPSMSVLLRPAGSTVLLIDPDYRGWQPFDPAAAPDLSAYKTGGAICGDTGS